MRQYALLALLLTPVAAMAQPAVTPTQAEVRLCMPDMEVWPYLFDKGRKGSLAKVLRMATDKAAIRLTTQTYPNRRCHELLREGLMDAGIVAYSAPSAAAFVFPADAGKINVASTRLALLQVAVYRRKHSTADWDGNQFQHTRSIGLIHDAIAVRPLLERYQLKIDESNFTPQQHVDKLLAKRFDLLLGLPEYIEPAIAENDQATAIEKLPTPFMTIQVYLVFSQQFAATRADTGRLLWQAIAELSGAGVIERLRQDEQRPQSSPLRYR